MITETKEKKTISREVTCHFIRQKFQGKLTYFSRYLTSDMCETNLHLIILSHTFVLVFVERLLMLQNVPKLSKSSFNRVIFVSVQDMLYSS